MLLTDKRRLKMERFLELKLLLDDEFITLQKYYSDLSKSDIYGLIDFVAKFLEIKEIPPIRWARRTDATADIGGQSFFNRDMKAIEMLFFIDDLKFTDDGKRYYLLNSIIHELRHVWQAENQQYVKDFFTIDIYSDSEIDARCFANMFLEFFLLSPFESVDEKLENLLDIHEGVIIEDFLMRIFLMHNIKLEET